MESATERTTVHEPPPLDLPLKLGLARLANGISPSSVSMAYADWLTHLSVSPSKQVELAQSSVRGALRWWQSMGILPGTALSDSTPEEQDKRFSPEEWRELPFAAWARAFLAVQAWWHEASTGVRGVSEHHEQVVEFINRQGLDTLSPSNFVASNPQVLRRTAESGGMNLLTGFANWAQDALAVATDGRPRGVEAFLPGQAVALTPGKVVLRNRLMELIQYEPSTPQVHAQPVLIVPSWIMKFYILDLTPEDSLVKFLVGRGHTVFMISWKNPGTTDRGLGLEEYIHLGVEAAVSEVQARFPRQGIHATGYCLGGTLLAMAAAAAGAQEAKPFRTLTLLAAETDFSEPGELGLFIDESQISFLEDVMAGKGYLDGRQMAGAFQLINSKDLVWSKLVHEYLMGAQTPMTALRAWNADATRMPARMHSEYLRGLYLHDDLSEGRFRVNGEVVSLSDIAAPMFVVATERDHVSPWRSVYKVIHLVRSPVTFLLTSGGHNVGIVNPPAGPQAHPGATCWTATHSRRHQAPADPDAWLATSKQTPGSWWPHWSDWLARHSHGQVRAVPVSPGHLGLVAAPGTYVHLR